MKKYYMLAFYIWGNLAISAVNIPPYEDTDPQTKAPINRAHFVDLVEREDSRIFKHLPDYVQHPPHAPGLSSTKALNYSPLYIYMSDLRGGENVGLRNDRIQTLAYSVADPHLHTRHVGNVHIYSYYKENALKEGLWEFYSFINTIAAYPPRCIWGRPQPDITEAPFEALKRKAMEAVRGPAPMQTTAKIRLRLDFENKHEVFVQEGFSPTSRRELVQKFFQNAGHKAIEIEESAGIKFTDDDEWEKNRKSGYVYPDSQAQDTLPFFRIKVDLDKDHFPPYILDKDRFPYGIETFERLFSSSLKKAESDSAEDESTLTPKRKKLTHDEK